LSSNTIRKAKKLVENDGVSKIDKDVYQVKSSSDPEKSYFVTEDSCDCLGFKNFYKFHHGKGLKANCSHPDKNKSPNSRQKCAEIIEAYEALTN